MCYLFAAVLSATLNSATDIIMSTLEAERPDSLYFQDTPRLLSALKPEQSKRIWVVRAGDAGALAYAVRRSLQAFVVIECDPRYFVNDQAVQTVTVVCRGLAPGQCRGAAPHRQDGRHALEDAGRPGALPEGATGPAATTVAAAGTGTVNGR